MKRALLSLVAALAIPGLALFAVTASGCGDDGHHRKGGYDRHDDRGRYDRDYDRSHRDYDRHDGRRDGDRDRRDHD